MEDTRGCQRPGTGEGMRAAPQGLPGPRGAGSSTLAVAAAIPRGRRARVLGATHVRACHTLRLCPPSASPTRHGVPWAHLGLLSPPAWPRADTWVMSVNVTLVDGNPRAHAEVTSPGAEKCRAARQTLETSGPWAGHGAQEGSGHVRGRRRHRQRQKARRPLLRTAVSCRFPGADAWEGGTGR